ncbi:TIGR01777 family oxidoreductase [Pseudomonas sp. OIL-1]|uniref:TIGR01777 family oxidoreductase n=1 Tax=Pseudomonas sp. OIL-1 TaxID=2706126 RepID=UPI0013A7A2A9|nr:TIGR01777 family oxidoreductase [Pseudomonas sp. OIL-1]QIB50891.1 TIGR01777 family protein [Pseudomonas sp. OIL-1]
MHVLLTGGTGLVGRALCHRLLAQGHQVSVWSRRPEQVWALCGSEVKGVGRLEQLDAVPLDAVINLAGAPIADRRWSPERKAQLWASRVSLTEHLVDWMGALKSRPSVLISGSAIGWYGDGGEAELTEDSPANRQYAHTLCDAWEAAARRASSHGIRVCVVRTGLVLAPGGGFLQRLLKPFSLGLGGPIGSGRQYMSWIHIQDEVGIILHLLNHPECKGVYNATAPDPATSKAFSSALGKTLHRPAFMPLPGIALKAALGEMSILLLTGQRVVPARIIEAGYSFRHATLEAALDDVINNH